MNTNFTKMIRNIRGQDGFTLIEMLIVIIILGILAMVIIPQVTVSSEDAKVSALKTNLSGMRSAIEMYYAQHNQTYPGTVKETDGTTATDNTTAVTAMVAQLTQFSDATGKVPADGIKTAAYPFGPYIKGGTLPENPFNNKKDVVCDKAVTALTSAIGVKRAATAATGWKYLPVLGVIFANDETSAADDDKPHKQY